MSAETEKKYQSEPTTRILILEKQPRKSWSKMKLMLALVSIPAAFLLLAHCVLCDHREADETSDKADARSQVLQRLKLQKTDRNDPLNDVNGQLNLRKLWDNFKALFNKSYATLEEDLHRFEVFVANHKKIFKHNQEFRRGKHSYSLSMNEYGDMTHEEFVRTVNGFKRNFANSMAKSQASTFLTPLNARVPDSVDWRDEGYVTPVKNQGHCGSCWSFSATGALEGQHFRKSGQLVSLSEQNLIDCSVAFGNQGCNGGLMDQAFQYIKSNDGVDTESSYPYLAKDGKCHFNRSDVGADDTGFTDIPSGDEDKLKEAVGTVGPVSVAIDASHESFQFYKKGVYNEPDCSSEQLDHGVLVVGYGTTDDGTDYWIVKNSWGPGWGEQGYVKMTRNQQNQCGIATAASYPLV